MGLGKSPCRKRQKRRGVQGEKVRTERGDRESKEKECRTRERREREERRNRKREEPKCLDYIWMLSLWAGKFRVGPEGCWENLEAKSALVTRTPQPLSRI